MKTCKEFGVRFCGFDSFETVAAVTAKGAVEEFMQLCHFPPGFYGVEAGEDGGFSVIEFELKADRSIVFRREKD